MFGIAFGREIFGCSLIGLPLDIETLFFLPGEKIADIASDLKNLLESDSKSSNRKLFVFFFVVVVAVGICVSHDQRFF